MGIRSGQERGASYRKFYRRLTDQLCEAVRIDVRYNTQNSKGMTRAEENYTLGLSVPGAKIEEYEKDGEPCARAIVDVPVNGRDLWKTFFSVSRLRSDQGSIQPGAITDWLRVHGKRMSVLEARVIEAMDRAFVDELRAEIALNKALAEVSA